jgi:hypothetical protein
MANTNIQTGHKVGGRSSPRREMNGSDWHYYQDIVEKYKNGSISQFNLHDIFKFDWDYLYVSTYPEIDYASLKNQLGISSEILPLDRNEYKSRLLFIKNDIIVYDFKFSRDILLFLPGNICVQKSQALVSVDKDNGIMYIRFAYLNS